MGSEYNVVHHYAYYNFFLYLRLNGSVNGFKPRIYYITYNWCITQGTKEASVPDIPSHKISW